MKTINKRKYKSLFGIDKFLIIQNENIKKKNNVGIKIRFLHTYQSSWNWIVGLIKEFINDEKYDVVMVIGESDNESTAVKHAVDLGIEYYLANEYDAEIDKPDIFVIYHPRETAFIRNLKQNCKLVFCGSTPLILDTSSYKDFWKFSICYRNFDPDYFLFDKLMYNELCNKGFPKDKMILAGNPIYDDIYNSISKKEEYARRFEKLNNKRTLLWATDHGAFYHKISNDLSFDVYAKSIFEYFNKHKDIGLIFRPHPTFIWEMTIHGIWGKNEYQEMRRIIDESENIVYDDSESMNDALVYCDSIIADAFCSISCGVYPLHKPIGMLYRNENLEPIHKDLANSLIAIKNKNDLIKFLDRFTNDYDNLCKMNFNDDNIYCHFDGCNASRAKTIIEEKYKLANKA